MKPKIYRLENVLTLSEALHLCCLRLKKSKIWYASTHEYGSRYRFPSFFYVLRLQPPRCSHCPFVPAPPATATGYIHIRLRGSAA